MNTYAKAAGDLRRRIYGGERGSAILTAVEELIETGPPEHRPYWKRWKAALLSGRRIKVGTYPVHDVQEGTFPPHWAETVADVESAFEGVDEA